MLDLATIYADKVAGLSTDEEEGVLLTGDLLGEPPEELETDAVAIRAHPDGHTYHPATRRDRIDVFADKPTYRALGLLIFATVLGESATIVHLRDRELAEGISGTHVERLVVDARRDRPDPYPGELVVTPSAYGYWPSPPDSRHPLADARLRSDEFPTFTLTNDEDFMFTDEQWKRRNVVRGFDGIFASSTVGALLLNIGLPQNQRAEFNLETSVGGFKSVSDYSAEVRFWVGYDYTL